MLLKFFLAFALFSTFNFHNLVDAVPPQNGRPGPSVNEGFSNQKSVLLTGSEVPSNQTCFRSTFFTDRSIRYLHVKFEVKTGENLLDDHNWEHAKMKWNEFWGNAMCSSAEIEYIFNYELPNGWENGAQLKDFHEQQIVLARKLFFNSYPKSCEEGGEKFLNFLKYVVENGTLKTESEQKLNPALFQINMKTCYSMLKYSDVHGF